MRGALSLSHSESIWTAGSHLTTSASPKGLSYLPSYFIMIPCYHEQIFIIPSTKIPFIPYIPTPFNSTSTTRGNARRFQTTKRYEYNYEGLRGFQCSAVHQMASSIRSYVRSGISDRVYLGSLDVPPENMQLNILCWTVSSSTQSIVRVFSKT